MAAEKQYRWRDLSISIGSRIFEGVTGLKHSEKIEKEYIYGRGEKPIDIVSGNKSNEGSIKLWQSEVEAMIEEAPDNDILKLRFNITEALVPTDGGKTVVNILKDCEITELSSDFNQGDKNQIIELPFIFLETARQQ